MLFWTGYKRGFIPGKNITTPKEVIVESDIDRERLAGIFNILSEKDRAFSGLCVLKGTVTFSSNDFLGRVVKCSETLKKAVDTELKVGVDKTSGQNYPIDLKNNDVLHLHQFNFSQAKLTIQPVDAVILDHGAGKDGEVIYTRDGIKNPGLNEIKYASQTNSTGKSF